ncbi:MAG TPA: penicillin-binding transpeptidase domain-containing protein [Candidatus Acidoferrum sp.]|nr:penicillin-binding transpeptidase domain-containing protein [Candidatus Acidoferrum sp.]
MGAVISRPTLCVFAAVLFAAPVFPQQTTVEKSHHSLFSQSTATTLQRKYGKSEVSYLLLDADSGAVLASHWEEPDKAIPMGSLVKPFTALAYAETHDFRYPKYVCKGSTSGCWQRKPHGELDLTNAISVSCNAYFMHLAENVSNERETSVARSFGLEPSNENAAKEDLIGIGDRWKIAPMRMALAYLELSRRKDAPGVAPVIEGMRQSGRHGTGAAIDRQLKHSEALVKTGTAPCTHARWAPADGFVLALVPAEKPELLLLIRMHSVTGARAAETAGRMLRDMEE